MKYRVIQWATGGVGCAAIQGIVNHPELELVGCWVHSRSKDGRDAGELAGIAPLGVAATRDVDALLALDADCVLYSPILADAAIVERILRSGKNVVTPLGWFFPWRGQDFAALEVACHAGGVTLHGTGIHPGGITERFPLMVSALSRKRHARPRRRVLGHSHLQRPRRHQRHHAVRQDAGRGGAEPDGRVPRHRFLPVDRHGRRRARRRARRDEDHATRDRGRHPAHRFADRPDPAGTSGGAALHLGGRGGRRAAS